MSSETRVYIITDEYLTQIIHALHLARTHALKLADLTTEESVAAEALAFSTFTLGLADDLADWPAVTQTTIEAGPR